MERIFLKNYKGFKHQVISLDEMNFLVGENSTGKTSFLKVINLLSSSEFWYAYEFNNNEVELGYFDEIINKQTTDKFFQLGIEKSILIDDDGNKGIFRVIFEFHESNSVPTLKQIKVNIEDNDVLVKFTKKQISYRLKRKNNSSFNEWVTDFEFPKSYKVLSVPRNLLPVSILIHFIEREIKKNKNSFTTRRSFGNELLYSNYKWLAPIRAKAKRTYESYKIKFSPQTLSHRFKKL